MRMQTINQNKILKMLIKKKLNPSEYVTMKVSYIKHVKITRDFLLYPILIWTLGLFRLLYMY